MIQLIHILEAFIHTVLSAFFWPGISNEQQREATFSAALLLHCEDWKQIKNTAQFH